MKIENARIPCHITGIAGILVSVPLLSFRIVSFAERKFVERS